MKWSQLKKRIEGIIAESVRGRVELGSTSYRKSHDQEGRGWILIDKHEIINMCSITYEMELYQKSRTTNEEYSTIEKKLHEGNLFSQWNWHNSLFSYLNLSINDILTSDNAIIRAIGMIDVRVGKRRLQKIDISEEHDLVKKLYHLRCEAEGITTLVGLPAQPDLLSEISTIHLSKDSKNKKKSIEAATKLSTSKTTRSLKKFFNGILQGNITDQKLDTEFARAIYKGSKEFKNVSQLIEILTFLEEKSKLLKDIRHIQGAIELSKKSEQWIRPYANWQAPSHNPDKQFSSFARHLLANYPIPRFMDNAWLKGNELHQKWFIHIGAGKNIRSAENLPIPLTKKIAHYFLLAPENYAIEAAMRWGQIHALAGDKRIVEALLESRIIDDFRDNDFWSSVFRFFIKNPMLDTIHINPIIDYIWNQKYENRVVFVERGVAEEVGPEQPNFSMRGRTVNSLLRQVDDWHRQLGKEIKSGNLQWKKSLFHDFQFIEGSEKKKNMKIWIIKELLSSKELVVEGRQQRHCVATYAHSCHNGKCSIWTMDVQTEEGIEKLLTIELNHPEKIIKQVRGKKNRIPTDKEIEILKRWSVKEHLDVAGYISSQ
ncbi:MAG: PcfJ domain-containing protein [Pseudomonadota bacterium]